MVFFHNNKYVSKAVKKMKELFFKKTSSNPKQSGSRIITDQRHDKPTNRNGSISIQNDYVVQPSYLVHED